MEKFEGERKNKKKKWLNFLKFHVLLIHQSTKHSHKQLHTCKNLKTHLL
uniref:Uncharacterized protein n=1 Tax=Rhizophora mucronata TaxID=61149 RepID=A0A2P2QZ39_RHIMU